MTTVDTRVDPSTAGTSREAYRRELADLLGLDHSALPDTARLVDDLALDSLAMMRLLTWLETGGVTLDSASGRPTTVGGVLSLVEKATFPGLSIRVTGGTEPYPVGPTDVTARARPAADPLVPVLETHAFRLTSIEPNDMGFLYTLAIQPETCFRWRYRGAPPPFERFTADLWKQVLVQYVARRAEDNEPVGLVVAYGANVSLRHAYLGAVFQPRCAGTGLAAQIVALFARHLFHTFPLRKLYLEVPGFNWPQLRSGEKGLFQVEGVLRDHHYYAGRYWDQFICAIYRDEPIEDER